MAWGKSFSGGGLDNGRPRSPYTNQVSPSGISSRAITPQILASMARRRLGG